MYNIALVLNCFLEKNLYFQDNLDNKSSNFNDEFFWVATKKCSSTSIIQVLFDAIFLQNFWLEYHMFCFGINKKVFPFLKTDFLKTEDLTPSYFLR